MTHIADPHAETGRRILGQEAYNHDPEEGRMVGKYANNAAHYLMGSNKYAILRDIAPSTAKRHLEIARQVLSEVYA